MIQRCTNPKNKAYKNYGGRGITVCVEWMKFENFLRDMGNPPSGGVLDRIDNDKGYCVENCRWTTTTTSAVNRSYAVQITHNGKTQCVKEWADELGMRPSTIYSRIRRGLLIPSQILQP